MTKEKIENLRNRKWRTRRDLRVTTEEQALHFIDDVGFCFAFASGIIAGTRQSLARAAKDTFGDNLLPSLWEAVCGVPGGIPALHSHHDPYIGPVWNWKDSLPLKKKVFYGKILKQKPTFISLRMLPFFYALFGSATPEKDYLEEYHQGIMSREAKNIFECLLRFGSLPNTILRGEVGMLAKADKYRFQKAMAELQSTFKVVKVDVSDDGTIWNIFSRWMPEIIEAASRLKREEAMREIILKYITAVIITTPQMISRLFRWNLKEIERVLELLVRDGEVKLGVKIVGLEGDWIMKTIIKRRETQFSGNE